MPILTVTRFQDPVPFVGKIDEAAANPKPLQCRENHHAFTDRHAEVQIIVNDQHGRAILGQVGREPMRGVFFIRMAIVAPGRTTVLPFVEPEFIGGHVHGLEIPHATMVDDGLEFAGVDGEPVHHVAAKTRSSCSETL